MKIQAKGLGYREAKMLIGFIDFIMRDFFEDISWCEVTFSYDLHMDEPYFINEDGQFFTASDYDITFDSSNNPCYI